MPEIRFYLVPKGTEFNTTTRHLNNWYPVGNTDRCLVFHDPEGADACLLDIVRSQGRREVEHKYSANMRRVEWLSSARSRKTAAHHKVEYLPKTGTLCVAVAWWLPLVEIPTPPGRPNKLVSRRGGPETPRVKLFTYLHPDDVNPDRVARFGVYYGQGDVRYRWDSLTPSRTEDLEDGYAIRHTVLSQIG